MCTPQSGSPQTLAAAVPASPACLPCPDSCRRPPRPRPIRYPPSCPRPSARRRPVKTSVRMIARSRRLTGVAGTMSRSRWICSPLKPRFARACPLRLLAGHLQPLTLPQAFNPLVVDLPAGTAQQSRDPPIAVAAILTGQLDHIRNQAMRVVTHTWDTALGRAVLSQHQAGPTLPGVCTTDG